MSDEFTLSDTTVFEAGDIVFSPTTAEVMRVTHWDYDDLSKCRIRNELTGQLYRPVQSWPSEDGDWQWGTVEAV